MMCSFTRRAGKKPIFLLILFALPMFSATALAASWNGTGYNALWSNSAHWVGGIPGPGNHANWNRPNTSPCHLDYDAGTIRTIKLSEYHQGRLIIQDGGRVHVSDFVTIMNRTGYLDIHPGGQLIIEGDLIIGQWDDLPDDEMVLTMHGGWVDVAGTLRFGFYFNGVNGHYTVRTHAQLDGGQLYANSIGGLQPNRGTIDITEGQLILSGNQESNVNSWTQAGFLSAYNGEGKILCDYNQTTPGKTTIYAIAPVPGDANRDFAVDFSDLIIFADEWLSESCNLNADFSGDCRVGLVDFSQLAANWFYGVSFLPHTPYPADGQSLEAITLQWDAFATIESFDIYFGTNRVDVLNADHSSPEFQGNQAEKSFALGALTAEEIYYWRIDAILGNNRYPGPVWSLANITIPDTPSPPATTGYIGATLGWQYSAQLEGPVTFPNQTNISLFNPQRGYPDATWKDWAEQIHQAGLDFICPNLTGSWPNTSSSPTDMAPLVTVLKKLGNTTKFAIFDDNAASWCAQWNMANGRGYWYEEPFDISDEDNWVYLYDYNYKLFYETVPDDQLFKIDGRPVLWIWTGNPYFIGNAHGNLSRALTYVRQRIQEDFGYNPFIIGNADFIGSDPTCAAPGILDATHGWFGPPHNPYTLSIFNGIKTGVVVPQFFNPSNPSGFLDPDHGRLLDEGLSGTVGAGAMLTLLEGFTNYEEDAAIWRVRNIDENGNPLSYEQTYYDYPNQRLNIVRKHTLYPFPHVLKLQAEGCDTFGGAAGGGTPQLYRNGDIGIERTEDFGGGFNVGWTQPDQWLQWEEVPMEGRGVLQVRIATMSDNNRIHLVIDGQRQPTVTLPNTGGWQNWTTVDTPEVVFVPGSYHTVRVVFETGAVNLNWIRWIAGGDGNTPPTVSLTSPANNSEYSEPAGITLNATAFDSDVSQVDFYSGSTQIGSSHQPPYSVAWDNIPAGNYRLSAKATDNNGAITTSLPVFVQVTPLSRHKTAAASSSRSNNVPANAVDGNSRTRWESRFSDPQWIYVDLGQVYDIGKIVLHWEHAYASGYQIQVSDDASSWTTIYSTETGAGGHEVLQVSGTGRYVRMYGTTRGTPHGYSLYKFGNRSQFLTD